jgi:predicted nucleotidyltransferase
MAYAPALYNRAVSAAFFCARETAARPLSGAKNVRYTLDVMCNIFRIGWEQYKKQLTPHKNFTRITNVEFNVPLKYRNDIEAAVNLLKNEGCQSIYLFGSMVTGKIHENSDIDIGIKGLPPERFFRVYAELDNNLSNEVDLVDFDENNKFYNLLNSLGEVVEIG